MAHELIIPKPQIQMAIRQGTLADVPFMDALQKKYGKALGYFPTKQFEGYIEAGGVLIAEESDEATKRRSDGGEEKDKEADSLSSHFPSSLRRSVASSLPLGYII